MAHNCQEISSGSNTLFQSKKKNSITKAIICERELSKAVIRCTIRFLLVLMINCWNKLDAS